MMIKNTSIAITESQMLGFILCYCDQFELRLKQIKVENGTQILVEMPLVQTAFAAIPAHTRVSGCLF